MVGPHANSRFSTNVSSWICRWSKLVMFSSNSLRKYGNARARRARARRPPAPRARARTSSPPMTIAACAPDCRIALEQHALLRLAQVVLHRAVGRVVEVRARQRQPAGRRRRRSRRPRADPAQPDQQVVVHHVARRGRSRGAARAAAARRSRPRTPRASGRGAAPARAPISGSARRSSVVVLLARHQPAERDERVSLLDRELPRRLALDRDRAGAAARRFSLNSAIDARRPSSVIARPATCSMLAAPAVVFVAQVRRRRRRIGVLRQVEDLAAVGEIAPPDGGQVARRVADRVGDEQVELDAARSAPARARS